MFRKAMSLVVAFSFLAGNIYAGELLSAGRPTPDTLAPESRLDPITDNNVMLDIMKLHAEIEYLEAKGDIGLRERAELHELFGLDRIDGLAGLSKKVHRAGDKIVYDFRSKVVAGDNIFIPCSIRGIKHGDSVVSTRDFLCCAKKTAEGKYDFEFIPAGSIDLEGLDISAALGNGKLLNDLLGKKREADVKAGIRRFAEQQNKDRVIREAILAGKIVRLGIELKFVRDSIVARTIEFLDSINPGLAREFETLVKLGQVMVISDDSFTKPHAGGVGIYLPDNPRYINAQTLIHEAFAKCGFSDSDAAKMETVYLTGNAIDMPESARTASFANRWNDVLNIDYNKDADPDGFQVPAASLLGSDRNWYLGIDSSTKSVKFILIERAEDGTKRIIWTHAEAFDDPHYKEIFGATGGVLPHPQAPEQYHTDPLMLADAMDRGMSELSRQFNAQNLRLDNIRSITGAGQQHGTVYLNGRAHETFNFDLKSESPLWEQLQDAGILANPTSPIWQDATTGKEVEAIDKEAGGAQKTREMTGSVGTRRFSLAQMIALFNRRPSARRDVASVLNIAAFNGALLAGKADFPWDPGDAAGTNAMRIREKTWWGDHIDKLIPGLSAKVSSLLPPIMPSDHIVGGLSDYWVEKYGFSPKTKVVNWTGDNPSSMTGMGVIEEGEIVISMGTSYTMFNFVSQRGLDRALESPIGHVFGEPTGQYMNLVCFQNGDDTLIGLRNKYISEEEAIKRAADKGLAIPGEEDKTGRAKLINDMRIAIFTEELDRTQAGNDGAMMVAMHKTEDVVRIPYVNGKTYSLNLDETNRAQVFRAAVESQAYFLKWVAEQTGLEVTNIKLTGGVSKNPAVRQIIADVFNANVNVLTVNDSVALGSAIRAMKAHAGLAWKDAIEGLTTIDQDKAVVPNPENVAAYAKHSGDFEKLLNRAIYEGRVSDAVEYHRNLFGQSPEAGAGGPGRINLLGEHTDYAGGHVLPIALDGVNVITTVSRNNSNKIVISSKRFCEQYEISLEDLAKIPAGMDEGKNALLTGERRAPEWALYPLGVIRQIMAHGINVTGLNISYDGNVPLGGGLSSSAAVESSVFTAVDEVFKAGIDKKTASQLCRLAEHWLGNHCGIMDQFVSFNGENGKAILLNCNTLEFEEVDISFLETAGYRIVAIDTGLPKTEESWRTYNARLVELQQAVDFFQAVGGEFTKVKTILDIAPNVTPEMFKAIWERLKSEKGQDVCDRVAHVVNEEARVQMLIRIAREANELAAKAKSGDETARQALDAKVKQFGAILTVGHESLRTIYKVSSESLDTLVISAIAHGSVGSRLTGAGFVGCTVNIVGESDLAAFREGVTADYRERFGRAPKITVSQAGDGASRIELAVVSSAASAAEATARADSSIQQRIPAGLPVAPVNVSIFKKQPVVTVVGSVVADIIVPIREGGEYPLPTEGSGLIATGDKTFTTPQASATKAYLDGLEPGLRENLIVTYGGPAFASAALMHELGAKVRLVCAVGDDDYGRGLIDLMKSKGMDTSGVRVIPDVSTSTNLIFSNQDTQTTAYNLALGGANEYLTAEDVRDEDLKGVATLHLGGIALNPKLEDKDSLASLIARAREMGIAVGMDTVVDLYGSEKEATGLMGQLDYITPSMGEARKLSGLESMEANLGFFKQLGAKAIFLKNGTEGSEIYTTAGSVFGVATNMHMPALTVAASDFVDSTGAGDSYSALVACGIASGMTPEEAAKGGTVCGALNCYRKGGGTIGENPVEAYNQKMAELDRLLSSSQVVGKSTIDLAAAEARSTNAVIFISQKFAAPEQLNDLKRAFPNAEFVPFKQSDLVKVLPGMLGDARYEGRKKVIVTVDLLIGQMQGVFRNKKYEKLFKEAIPLNVAGCEMAGLTLPEQKSYRKGVATIALLASALPQNADDYKTTNSYMTLKALLGIVFGDEKAADEYIRYIVNPNGKINIGLRYGYLIGKVIGSARELIVNEFMRIVNIFA